jgi:APA family basic amino acid/polyamine antiporter
VSASYAIVIIQNKNHTNSIVKTVLLGLFGFLYSLWAIYGSSAEVVFYGLLLLLLGIPFYVFMQWNKMKRK